MSDFLSQEEINALLSGVNDDDILTAEEQDVLGEIGNISMGASATTLYTLLRNKVTITTPRVSIISWEELKQEFKIPYVGVQVEYTEGLKGNNLLILKKEDVLKITDLMMGGNGDVKEEEISELHLSAIGEAMNQMIGSASTSLSTLLNMNINISPPKAFIVDVNTRLPEDISFTGDKVVKIAFKMVIGEIIDSEIMQLLPISFAKQLVEHVVTKNREEDKKESFQSDKNEIIDNSTEIENEKTTENNEKTIKEKQRVPVKPVIFQNFDDIATEGGEENEDNLKLIMDIPLNVTVELGRTKKLIKDILELNEGSIIELDKIAGEPVDILVNGKFIAKGEVVVIDENFGVRIIDIIQENKRINSI
ncbi:MAG: flagellar motor switch phosphatase FliY [Thermoanaerobacteraceae bacterium]|nr:flagellar motor switch phosphatase FliY [Thermoanaerobacteraceae bacterium]